MIIYSNTDDKDSTRLGENWEWSTDVFVEKGGPPQQSRYYEGDLHEIAGYNGFENPLKMHQTYTHKFQCVYQLENYPFDTQV